MAVSNIVRNLRDGELTIKDGDSKSMTVLLDQGDLSWTQRLQTIEIKDRGSIANGHLRKGDEESVALSFSARWTQLISASGDPLQLYEMLSFRSASSLTSTSTAGEQQTLTFEFTVTDPKGAASEKIVFSKVYRETLTMSEGDEANTIAFTGKAFQTAPVVSRV